ncbi:MAG: tetraacyldisaccharide 4'-kinase [Vampirovibrionales bacterium]|nr:tetraacyldisaccharide 4'-kinase [Vampirovibrionales bacterium]
MLTTCRHWIESQHRRPTPMGQALLAPLAWGYGLGVWVRNALYDWKLMPTVAALVPVISVGNLTTGGTGKTPIVKALTHALVAKGLKVVVLTRGYKATEPLDYGQPTGPQHGDEAWWLQQQVPQAIVIVGKNRSANALKACEEYHPDMIVLEDGFQHRRLGRAVDVVLMDASTDPSHTAILPEGSYREPLASLKRAPLVWLTKGDETQSVLWVGKIKPFIQSDTDVQRIPFDAVTLLNSDGEGVEAMPKQAVLVSGLAKPDGFEASVQSLGVKVISHHTFGDHHPYRAEDVARVVMATPKEIPLITTEKDWVKLGPLVGQSRSQWHILRIEPCIPPLAIEALLQTAGLSGKVGGV